MIPIIRYASVHAEWYLRDREAAGPTPVTTPAQHCTHPPNQRRRYRQAITTRSSWRQPHRAVQRCRCRRAGPTVADIAKPKPDGQLRRTTASFVVETAPPRLISIAPHCSSTPDGADPAGTGFRPVELQIATPGSRHPQRHGSRSRSLRNGLWIPTCPQLAKSRYHITIGRNRCCQVEFNGATLVLQLFRSGVSVIHRPK